MAISTSQVWKAPPPPSRWLGAEDDFCPPTPPEYATVSRSNLKYAASIRSQSSRQWYRKDPVRRRHNTITRRRTTGISIYKQYCTARVSSQMGKSFRENFSFFRLTDLCEFLGKTVKNFLIFRERNLSIYIFFKKFRIVFASFRKINFRKKMRNFAKKMQIFFSLESLDSARKTYNHKVHSVYI